MKQYARIFEGVVAEVIETDGDITKMFHADLVWIDCTGVAGLAVGWSYDGADFTAPPPPAPPTEEELEAAVGLAVSGMLDQLAKSWDYESYQSARTYLGDKSKKFAAEAKALADFGSDCFSYLDGIKTGVNPRPSSIDALLAALPSKPARPQVS